MEKITKNNFVELLTENRSVFLGVASSPACVDFNIDEKKDILLRGKRRSAEVKPFGLLFSDFSRLDLTQQGRYEFFKSGQVVALAHHYKQRDLDERGCAVFLNFSKYLYFFIV